MATIEGIDEVDNLLDMLKRDLNSLAVVQDNEYFMARLRDIIAENFQSVWSSDGGIIGEDWDDNDLVDSGNLRDSLTSASRLKITKVGSLIIVSSEVYYAEYVNDRDQFYGLSSPAQTAINGLISEWLLRNGNLNWE